MGGAATGPTDVCVLVSNSLFVAADIVNRDPDVRVLDDSSVYLANLASNNPSGLKCLPG